MLIVKDIASPDLHIGTSVRVRAAKHGIQANHGPNRVTNGATEVPQPYRPTLLADLSRLAVLFLVIVLANVLFLLIALSFLTNRGPDAAG